MTLHNPRSYLLTVLTRTYLRRRERMSAVSWETVIAVDPRLDVAVESVVDREWLWQALARLPDRPRIVLVLRYFNDLPDGQIAEILACPDSTVRSLAARGLAALRRTPELRSEQSVLQEDPG